jgi:hypothetical protein
MLFFNVLNTIFVNYQCEADGPPLVFSISWRDLALGVSCFE